MAYKSYTLSNIYSYLLEGDQMGTLVSRFINLKGPELKNRLSQLKHSNPELYGMLLVDVCDVQGMYDTIQGLAI